MAHGILIPAHFHADLQPFAEKLGAWLVPYDKDGVPQSDSTDSVALFRWWISREQGDRLIEQHPRLRWIHTGSAGIDQILTPAFLASSIVLTNSAGVHAVSIAEWVVSAILAVEKDLVRMFEQQHARVWEKVERSELGEKRVVVLGAGRIAQEIAVRLRPFGVHLTAIRRHRRENDLFDDTRPVAELGEAVRSCSWLVIAVPLTEETRNLVDARVIGSMPQKGRIVNVARGEIVDQEALLAAILEGRIAGAVLDVFREEPLPSDHPFWSMPNVFVLPHTTWRSPQVRQKQIALFAENLQRFVRGEPMLNVVDRKSGY
ncbi:MAG TPA: D-2-hydroxyacid dehydrogenase [Thermoanaerobaculia bacterium]